MVLLKVLEVLTKSEDLFAKGHPVQLLLLLFTKFNQDAMILLINRINYILPKTPTESLFHIEQADKIWESALRIHQMYQRASPEQRACIDAEIQKRQKSGSYSKTAGSDDQWMNEEQSRLCDLHYRKATKLAPNCLNCYLSHFRFLFQCRRRSEADKIYKKLMKLISDLKDKVDETQSGSSILTVGSKAKIVSNSSSNIDVDGGRFNSKLIHKSKGKKHRKQTKSKPNSDGIPGLSLDEINRIEVTIMFYRAYLLYQQTNDQETFNQILSQCLDQSPHDIGLRSQWIVHLTTSMKYEEAYLYAMSTLKQLQVMEHEQHRNEESKQKKKKKKKNDKMKKGKNGMESMDGMNEMERIRYYRVTCGIGCAAIRCVYRCDWSMVAEHLQYVIENDTTNIGVIRYALSYALHQSGDYKESKKYYDLFVEHIDTKRAEAESEMKKRNEDRNEKEERTENEEQVEALLDATSELRMDCFKWHPDDKNGEDNFVEMMVDCMAVCLVVLLICKITGLTPHVGDGLMDRFVIGMVLMVSCLMVTPSLGIMLIAVSLPSRDGASSHFDYLHFLLKWMTASAGILFVSRVVVGGQIPLRKLF